MGCVVYWIWKVDLDPDLDLDLGVWRVMDPGVELVLGVNGLMVEVHFGLSGLTTQKNAFG